MIKLGPTSKWIREEADPEEMVWLWLERVGYPASPELIMYGTKWMAKLKRDFDAKHCVVRPRASKKIPS